MHWFDGTGWEHMGMMWIWVVLGLLVVAALVVFLVRGAASTSIRGEADDDPEAIVKRRYASGEIDEDEMKRRLDQLHGT